MNEVKNSKPFFSTLVPRLIATSSVRAGIFTLAAILFLPTGTATAATFSITVDGSDAIFLAGRTDVTIPAASDPWTTGTHLIRHGIPTPEEIQEVEDRAQETTTIKAFNFSNVKKTSSGGGSKKPWSIDNFSVSYAFSETTDTDPILRENRVTETSTSLDYRFSTRSKSWQPFKGISSKSLRIIKEFNFNFIPNSFSFNTNVDRYKGERTFRLPDEPVFTFNDNRFKWERQYKLKWDFTKSLNFDFSAKATS